MSRKPRPWTPEDIAAVERWKAAKLAEGHCPWSGLPLSAREDTMYRCDICDCPGIDAKELGT